VTTHSYGFLLTGVLEVFPQFVQSFKFRFRNGLVRCIHYFCNFRHWGSSDTTKSTNVPFASFLVAHNRGGRVTTGSSDSGFIYKVYGFGYIRELELLQEAGFHPLEVSQSATMYGAELLPKENGVPLR
jgi:hypothetical protein